MPSNRSPYTVLTLPLPDIFCLDKATVSVQWLAESLCARLIPKYCAQLCYEGTSRLCLREDKASSTCT